ncbi:MAG: hypothetical protein Q9214_002593 [Letrouitia sp. 1 TL-2023]
MFEPRTFTEIDTWFHFLPVGPLSLSVRIEGSFLAESQVCKILHPGCFANLFVLFVASGSEYFAKTGFSFRLGDQSTFTPNKPEWVVQDDDGDAYREREMKHTLRKGSYSTLNVYFMPRMPAGYLGLATYPVDNPTDEQRWLDGVRVDIKTMPDGALAGYNEGKTLVHEVGHWLGLFHLWYSDYDTDDHEGGTCTPNGGDQVDDTPLQMDPSPALPNGQCPVGRKSCPESNGEDNWWNLMDYGWDRCRKEFTPGQVTNMHRSWNNQRRGK